MISFSFYILIFLSIAPYGIYCTAIVGNISLDSVFYVGIGFVIMYIGFFVIIIFTYQLMNMESTNIRKWMQYKEQFSETVTKHLASAEEDWKYAEFE